MNYDNNYNHHQTNCIELGGKLVSINLLHVHVYDVRLLSYAGDDINKFLWMVRIAEGEHPQDIKVRQAFNISVMRV